jgi:hypothetical protein
LALTEIEHLKPGVCGPETQLLGCMLHFSFPFLTKLLETFECKMLFVSKTIKKLWRVFKKAEVAALLYELQSTSVSPVAVREVGLITSLL